MYNNIINIALDSDDTIFSTEAFINKYAPDFFMEKYNMDIVNPDGYNIQEMFNCSEVQQSAFWKKYFIKYLVIEEPIFNFVNMLKKLKQDENTLYSFKIFTSLYKADDPHIGNIIRFLYELGLKKHGIYKYIDKIHYIPYSKDSRTTANSKIDLYKKEQIDIVIEDKAETVKSLEGFIQNKEMFAILKATKNNENSNIEGVKRLHTYNEIYSEIKNINNKIIGNNKKEFVKYSGPELKRLSLEDKREYYKKYRDYISALPFDVSEINKNEKNYKKLGKIVEPSFNFLYKPIVLNKSNIPADKGLIFISNHQTNKDLLILLTALYNNPYHPLVKEEFKDMKIINKLVYNISSVYVDRNSKISKKDSLIELSKYLENNFNIWIAPEGTYTDKKLGNKVDEFKGKSPFILSQIYDAKIVPIALSQNYQEKQRPIVNFLAPSKVQITDDINEVSSRYRKVIRDGIIENEKYIKTLERKYY